jgi:isoleucyl-tRNA synthetase
MFSPVDKDLDLVALEDRVLARWRNDDVFSATLQRRAGAPEWVFYEGPPTANGRPGIHHVWARLFKDIYPRYHTMRGRHVARKGGWDCHGLPVEVEVERELGFSGKPQIEDFGIEAFNARCRASVQRYVEDWQALTSRIGMWIDTANAYWTMANDYIETVWWLFARMWANGDIYEGFKVVPYCGRCGTALSSHELGQPGAYRDVTEPSVYVRFPVRDRDFDLVVWTTTPWTLPSNVAAAIGADIEYVRARDPEGGGRDVVLARARVDDVLGADAEVLGPIAAADLVGLHYDRPFGYVDTTPEANVVIAAEFVTTDDGSGIVHLAPAFGEIDREVLEPTGLPVLNPVDANARFTSALPAPYRGKFVKDADPALIEELQRTGRMLRVADHTHSYPHCWRCDTPLVYWAKPTWFARTSAHREELLAQNETINWHPATIKHGRFGNWLEGNIDWALSRDRFWGTPIPVWRCRECERDTCVGSVAQLAELAGKDLSGLDLHRPFVDDVVIACPECGGRALRVEPVLDAWFDSGSMPAAQLHYPFENEDDFARRFPADFICEAIDQTRGWFYSLLAVNTLVFDRTPYRNVVCLGLLVDENGKKMSKSRGNVIDPWTVLDSRGAEALRWYMFSSGSPWSETRVSVQAIDEAANRFLRTLWNTYSFFVTYANLDAWEPAEIVPPRTHALDRWILSRTHRTVATVTDALERFDALVGARALDDLVDDLSNWYVRRSRPRFWKSSDPAAHATLHECLALIARIVAPYCPFLADELWRNLAQTDESVHLEEWPAPERALIDDELEAEMLLARDLTSLGRAARVDAKIAVRQPLPRAVALLGRAAPPRDGVAREIESELNVKTLEIVDSLEGLLDYTVVPNFRVLGPRLGKLLPAVKAALATIDGHAVRAAFDAGQPFVLDIDGTRVELHPDDVDVRVQSHEGLSLVRAGDLAVALDLTIDDELRAEGIARELARAINDARKQEGFEIADRITVEVRTRGAVVAAASRHSDWIAGETLATAFTVVELAETEPIDADALVIADEPIALSLAHTSR